MFLKWVISLEIFFLSKLAGHGQNWSSMDVFEMGYRWFQLFFIDFQLFHFLACVIYNEKSKED
jgi:hypothetical protein